MFKKWFGGSEKDDAALLGPYRDPSLNTLYELLFCDDLGRYRAAYNGPQDGVWEILCGSSPDLSALRALGDNEGAEARLRALAYLRLRQSGEEVPKKRLLGVVLEVGMLGGLDTLAAYSDGTARYFNQSGKLIIWEAVGSNPRIDGLVKQLISASQQVVDRIGPWNKPRLKAPSINVFRMSFVVSDGLYFGQGPMAVLQRDPMGGPVIGVGTQLLQALISKAGS